MVKSMNERGKVKNKTSKKDEVHSCQFILTLPIFLSFLVLFHSSLKILMLFSCKTIHLVK